MRVRSPRIDPPERAELSALAASVVAEFEDMGEPVTLAEGAAALAGSAWPVLSPWIGALGAFVVALVDHGQQLLPQAAVLAACAAQIQESLQRDGHADDHDDEQREHEGPALLEEVDDGGEYVHEN